MPYVIRCYEGQDEWGSKKWLAHLNLGNDMYMSFLRGSKKEAEDAARAWYEVESKRFKYNDSSETDNSNKVKVMNDGGDWGSSGWGEQDTSIETSGRGHHFAGKVWMVKGEGFDKQKKRVDKSEVETLEADGWRKGGPRS